MSTVITNSTTPRPISAAVWTPPDSPNWRTMIAGIVSPRPNTFGVICADAPITRATAMVSPMARPRPSMTAPTMPPKLCGNTAPLIISHLVAPSASAACLSEAGTVANTSRVIDVMMGTIMMATIRPAVMKLRPLLTGPNSEPITGTPPRCSCSHP